METITALAQALGLALAAGVSPYVTVLALGVASRAGWIADLPPALDPAADPWILGLAGVLSAVEFLATLVPGVASVWETVHTAIRPPAAALFAVLAVWSGDPRILLAAGLIGGMLGLAVHTAKMGLRWTIDASPEPVTNGGANVVEWGIVAALAVWVWSHPFLALGAGLLLLAILVLLVRAVVRTVRRFFVSAPGTA